MNVFLWNARARNTHVEATLNLSCPAQAFADRAKVAAVGAGPTALEDLDVFVAAHQNNPTSTNIGVYAVRGTRAAAAFFADCVAEADAKPKAHDQLLFHNLLGYHRMALHGSPVPKQANWKDRPGTPKPAEPITSGFIAPHVGVSSILRARGAHETAR